MVERLCRYKCGYEKLAHLVTISGSKVEAIDDLGKSIDKVVVGRIVSMEPHPDADRPKLHRLMWKRSNSNSYWCSKCQH